MSLLMKCTAFGVIVAMLAGCSKGKGEGDPQLHVTAGTLIGRWNAVPKDVAQETPGAQEVTGAAGEKVKMIWEYRGDHTCEMSVDAKLGAMPIAASKGATEYTWKALGSSGNTLNIEFSLPARGQQPAGRATIVFASKDRCTYSADDGEALVLNRLP